MKRGHACRQVGFTLIEILVGFAILAILIVTATMIINPAGLMGKAKDARRKSDFKKIRNAFEEYYSDKGSYPSSAPVAGKVSIVELMDQSNCGGSIFQPWLRNWPCDPNGTPYKLSVEITGSGENDLPKWYKIFTLLENVLDPSIPTNWGGGTYHVGNGEYSGEEVNYGASSTNVNWYDYVLDDDCTGRYSGCYRKDGINCLNVGGSGCVGSNCYTLNFCIDECNVSCCGIGCD